MHQCPTRGCTRQVPDRLLMCRSHWFELPRVDRNEVYESFHETGGGPEHIRRIQPILERQAIRMNRGETE